MACVYGVRGVRGVRVCVCACVLACARAPECAPRWTSRVHARARRHAHRSALGADGRPALRAGSLRAVPSIHGESPSSAPGACADAIARCCGWGAVPAAVRAAVRTLMLVGLALTRADCGRWHRDLCDDLCLCRWRVRRHGTRLILHPVRAVWRVARFLCLPTCTSTCYRGGIPCAADLPPPVCLSPPQTTIEVVPSSSSGERSP